MIKKELLYLRQQCKRFKILYVENEDKVKVQTAKVLSLYFDDITLAKNGRDGLNKFKQFEYDIIFTDIHMPIMDGFEVAQFLKSAKKTSDIPIIFVTAEFKSEEFIGKGYKLGALDYFTKPIEQFSFLNKMQLYIKLFLAQKVQKKQLDDTLLEYMNLMDNYILSADTDLEGKITRVSQSYCKLCGYEKEELVGKIHTELRSHDVSADIYKELWDTISKDKIWKGELKSKTKDGEEFWVELFISPMYDKKGTKVGYNFINQDLTYKKKLERIAITDGLTSLFNRRYFDQLAPKIVSSAQRYDKKYLCFALIDIDNFKKYNDTYGHQAGDDALIQVSKIFQSFMHRPDDYCFRMGGEEFCMIFLSEDKQKAFDFMVRIKEGVENLQIEHKKNDVSKFLTVSMGLKCEEGKNIENLERLYFDTDKLLYEAKETGRNKVIADI